MEKTAVSLFSFQRSSRLFSMKVSLTSVYRRGCCYSSGLICLGRPGKRVSLASENGDGPDEHSVVLYSEEIVGYRE